MIRNLAYCIALLHPLPVGLGVWVGGTWIYSTIILSSLIYPALEILTKPIVRIRETIHWCTYCNLAGAIEALSLAHRNQPFRNYSCFYSQKQTPRTSRGVC